MLSIEQFEGKNVLEKIPQFSGQQGRDHSRVSSVVSFPFFKIRSGLPHPARAHTLIPELNRLTHQMTYHASARMRLRPGAPLESRSPGIRAQSLNPRGLLFSFFIIRQEINFRDVDIIQIELEELASDLQWSFLEKIYLLFDHAHIQD